MAANLNSQLITMYDTFLVQPLVPTCMLLHQPEVKALENDQKECTDQRRSQETDDDLVAVAADEGSNLDSEERIKLERRRRRCPTVNVEKYLNSEDDEGEKKKNEASGNNRYLILRTRSITLGSIY